MVTATWLLSVNAKLLLKKSVEKNENYCTGDYRKRERSVLMNKGEDRFTFTGYMCHRTDTTWQ